MYVTLRTTSIAAVLLCLPLCLAADAPTTRPLDADGWRADLRTFAKELPRRHINPFTKISRRQFDEAVEQLDARLPGMSDLEAQVALMQLVARIGDGHTHLSIAPVVGGFGQLPVRLAWLKDGVFVTVIDEAHREALGARVLRIGEVDLAEAVRRIGSVFPHENDATLHTAACEWLTKPAMLPALGIAPSPREVELLVELPGQATTSLTLHDVNPAHPPTVVARPDAESLKFPKLQLSRQDYYWFEHLPESKTLYLRYDRCANDPRKMILLFAKELFEFIDANEDGIERVIIDLRGNGGGNSLVLAPVIRGLKARPKINQAGKLFVLIGPRTYSSAMLNALELKMQTRALLVGRPTGQKPNSFGEVKTFVLPNTAIKVSYSTKRFVTIRDNDPPSLMPDILVEPTSEEFFAGRDVALERVLADAPR